MIKFTNGQINRLLKILVRFSSLSTQATTSPPLPEKGETEVAIEPTAMAEKNSPGENVNPVASPGTRAKNVVLTTNPLTNRLITPEKIESKTCTSTPDNLLSES